MSIKGREPVILQTMPEKDTLRIYFRISIFAPLKEKVYER